MSESYIARYERNLIQKAVNEAVNDNTRKVKESIALKMREDGVSPDFIFKYFGIML